MDYRILGPLQVLDGDVGLALGGPSHRALLAALLLRRGEVVQADRLVEMLWGTSAPRSARDMLHVRVSGLRRALASGPSHRMDVLVARDSGYVLVTRPGEVDAGRFEALVEAGRACLPDDPQTAMVRFGEALALWNGPPFQDLGDQPFARSEIVRLEEMRRRALRARRDAELALLRRDGGVPLPVGPGRTRHNLPAAPAEFVDRHDELLECRELLEGVQLLTFTGGGGTGKTRLALEVAASRLKSYPDGVWLVELAPLRDPTLIVPAIAAAAGVPEHPDRDLLHQVVGRLRAATALLVLDHFDRMVEPVAAVVRRIVSECPSVRVICTGPDRLRLPGEVVRVVGGLPPESAAVRVFAQRASEPFRLDESTAGVVAQICRRVDGVPLAVELAAARTGMLDVTRIAATIGDRQPGRDRAQSPAGRAQSPAGRDRAQSPAGRGRAPSLGHGGSGPGEQGSGLGERAGAAERAGVGERATGKGEWAAGLGERAVSLGERAAGLGERLLGRHRDLHAVVEWSHGLLGVPEQRFFEGLSVFAGGFTAEAAAFVAGGDVGGLADAGLVAAEPGGRFRMPETIRRYAAARLDARGETARIQARHAGHYLTVTDAARAGMRGAGQREWLDRLTGEHADLRVAQDTWLERHEYETAARMAADLYPFWALRGHFEEGRRRLRQALASEQVTEPTRARALVGVATLAMIQGNAEAAATAGDAAAAVCRRTGDTAVLAHSLRCLALLAIHADRFGEAGELLNEAQVVARAPGGDREHGWVLVIAAISAITAGDDTGALRCVREADELLFGGEPEAGAWSAAVRGAARWSERDPRATADLYHAVHGFRELGDRRGLHHALTLAAVVIGALGNRAAAVRILRVADALRESMGGQTFRFVRDRQDEALATAERRLGSEDFRRAWLAGAGLAVDDAASETLHLLGR